MSTLKTNNIANVAGTASTDVLNVINGSAKAWVNFKGTGTVEIRAAYNVSSITDNGTGLYAVNFTNAFSDTNYGAVGSGKTDDITNAQASIVSTHSFATTSLGIRTNNDVPAAVDFIFVSVSIFR